MASSSCVIKASAWKGFATPDLTTNFANRGKTLCTRCLCQSGRIRSPVLQQPRRNDKACSGFSLGAERRGVPHSGSFRSRPQKRLAVRNAKSGSSSGSGSAVVGKDTPDTPSKETVDQVSEKESDQDEQPKEEPEGEGSAIEASGENEEDIPSGVTLESMMQMIKDAEKNILLLNQVRMRALEDLAQAKSRAELSGEEVKLLESRLKESEAKLKLLAQTQNKNQLLQEQIETLTAKLEEKETEAAKVKELETELGKAQEEAKRVLGDRDALQGRLEELEREMEERAKELEEMERVAEEKQELERKEFEKRAAELSEKQESELKELEKRAAELSEKQESEKKELEKRAAELSEKQESEKKELEKVAAELSEKLQEAERKVAEGVELEREKAKLEEAANVLKTVLEEAEKNREGLASEVANLRGVSEKLREAEKRMVGEQKRTKWLETQVAKLEKRLTMSAKDREKEARADNAELQAKLDELLVKSESAAGGLERLERERGELERRWQEAERRVGEFQAGAGRAKELQEKLSEAENALREANRRGEEVRQDAVRLATETGKLRTERDEIQRKLATETGKLRTERDDLERKLATETGDLQAERDELQRTLAMETGRLRTERDDLQRKLAAETGNLRTERDDLQRKLAETGNLRTERDDLQRMLSESDARAVEFRSTVEDRASLDGRAADLEALLKRADEAVMAAKSDVEERNEALEKAREELKKVSEQVRWLQATVSELEAEREIWVQSEEEKGILQQQVTLLKEQLVQSDVDMQAQVEMYTTEVQSFQEDIERLQLQGGKELKPVPVGEMPWEFWSNLLLRLDALALDRHLALDDAVELRLMAWYRDPRIRTAFRKLDGADDVSMAAGLLKLIEGKTRPGMHIVHVAAEMAPVAKVGGLADVVTGLGRALQKKGHLVEFVLPKYDCMDYSRVQDLKVLQMDLESYFEGQMHKNKLWRGIVEGLPVYFIEPHHPGRFFWRNAFYGESDDFKRFTYFCRAALEFIHKAGKKPDIIHCHDWQTALVAPLFWDVYAPRGMDTTQVAFTCHNFEYQGTDAPAALGAPGLDWREYYRPDRMQDNFMMDRINLLKGGIVFSNVVTTVSPTYSREVLGPEGGRGLHPTLSQHSTKFSGVLNGIDNEAWDPSTDPLLEYQYTADDLPSKYANKYALRQKLGLAFQNDDEGRPLVGCVTRLVPQKGVHLIRHAIYRTLEMGGQFILLGNSPVPSIQRDFEGIARHFDRSPHVRLILKYDEALSHMIYSASDMFVIPSMFEPCGLTQLIAMRYGAIPIARKTGGLNDSVFDVDDGTIPEKKKNGFCFTATDEQGLNYALDRAFDYYWEQPSFWQSLVQKAMRMDWGWDGPSEEYLALYRKAVVAARK